MDRLDATVYFLSAILQLTAMLFALRMSREAADRRPWLVLFGALLVMFGGRILGITMPQAREHLLPFIGFAVSAMLLAGLFAIRRVMMAERRSKLAAARSAAELEESEGRYRSLIELSPDALFVNAEGRIAYVNAAAVKMLGATDASQIVGRSPLDFISPQYKGVVESRIKQMTRQGGSVPPVYEDCVRLDGSTFPVEAIAVAVPWRGGRGIQVIWRDISERKRAEEEKTQLLASERAARSAAEHASRMKDEFLATMSHELRTPLNAIVGWAHLLLRGKLGGDDLQQGLSTIERNARVQTRLIEDLLDMSRIISGKLRLDIQRVLPVTIVEAAIDSLKPAADAKGVRLEKILDPLAAPVAGDPGRLQQVVWNLLSNAIKFTPKGGRAQVILKRVNSHVELTVADTGQGIAPEFLPFVFDRFRQADPSTTRKQGGLGIGLAIAKQLVELHGGTIRATSPGDGQGSSFIVQLPLMVVHAQAGDAERLHPRAASGIVPGEASRSQLQGVKVLVVDDELDARELIRRVLEDCKAEVLTAGSAAEAMPILVQQKPDVLLSDIGMPLVDGYDFLRQVRSMTAQSGGKTPAIALTAFARSEDRTRALMSGYQVHVSKPVEPAELVATVASVVGRTGQPR
ncbi:MAG: ATP-binding protein [Tepidisphaeraceae bacterium]|jgi:PAS domain S-box-containing protein